MSEVMPESGRGDVVQNSNQGPYRRVLCVCEGGILRSPTMAWILSNPPHNFNTRAVGCDRRALIVLDQTMIDWAHTVVLMSETVADRVGARFDLRRARVVVLNIPDKFPYRDPELIKDLEGLARVLFPPGPETVSGLAW